ncbi:MAG: thrombospondin type 3 repeat-containing protein, partial [Acidobacteriota bacterium]
AMSIFPADASVGQDLVMLNSTPPRLDVLSGTGTTFRVLPPEPLIEVTSASGMAVADLRQDGILDLLVLDGPGNKAEVLTTEPTGVQIELGAFSVGNNPVSAAIEQLVLHGADYDKDGVLNGADNCPTRYNPPDCPAYDQAVHPECFLDTPCVAQQTPFATCGVVGGQCDSDGNGVGDQCQILDAACLNVDSDLDTVPDYDQLTRKIDNCPWVANSNQADADTDGIGDACDNGTCQVFSQRCSGGPKNLAPCRTDADCEAPVNDIVTVNAGDGSAGNGTLSFLIGDATGSFRPAPASWSSLTGFSNPVAASLGHFAYDCIPFFGRDCTSRPQNDLVVAEKGSPGSGDDALKLFFGDGGGVFMPPAAPVAPQTALQGDPTRLLLAPAQRVCANPWLTFNDPRFRFDKDLTTAVLAVVEPGTSTLGILLPGSEGLVAPPANPSPLPLASPPADALFVDLNQDDVSDLVALSSGDFNPATPNTNITVYIGMGNGLFFTDPELNPAGVRDGMTLLATGHINLSTDATYPDVALFSSADEAPIILTNILTDRADIDGSGRVDGYDLAVLARSFGAQRGENFTLLADGTLLQAGSGATRALVPGACTLRVSIEHDEPTPMLPSFVECSRCGKRARPRTPPDRRV